MILRGERARMGKWVVIAPLLWALFVIAVVLQPCTGNSGIKDLILPEVRGWAQSGELQTYLPDTLYMYINGGADLYLSYGFQELNVAEYEDKQGAAITLEIYRHKTPFDAFGIYSQERLPSAKLLDIGAQGHGGKDFVCFVMGHHYVKINSLGVEDQSALIMLAERVAQNFGDKIGLPSVLEAFPVEGKIGNSEKFISKNFLGYSFFHSAFTSDYNLSGKRFQLFVIQGGDKGDCEKMIQHYLRQTGNGTMAISETRYTVSDSHHGAIDLVWKGGRIWGVVGLQDPVLGARYLKLLEGGLAKRPQIK